MSPDPTTPSSARRDWLSVLAHAPRPVLAQHALALHSDAFDWLRQPEVGLVMLRGRIGNTGDKFNLGEATLTRCVVRHRGAVGTVAAGVGYVLGRDAERAEWVARIDALLQQPEHHAALMHDVIEPLRAAPRAERTAQAARTAASRVQFFTLAPENAP